LSAHVTDIRGYVLAGGASRRLGEDKRRVIIDGITLLDRTRRLLARFTNHEPFVLGDNLAGFPVDRRWIVRDAKPGCGPLGGVVAALRHCPTRWCLLLAVDVPRLTTNDLQRLADGRSEDVDVITLSKTGRPEPLVALYNTQCADYWHRCLDRGMLSVIDILQTLRWKPVVLGADTPSLDGVNTPADLKRMVSR
jgi:molybdopterin-guanine dinucleotide biosynthesis protein A